MIVDTSALMAIVLEEPEAEACAHAIEEASVRPISAGTLLEAGIVRGERNREPPPGRDHSDSGYQD
jgi:ribonuclease VapC